MPVPDRIIDLNRLMKKRVELAPPFFRFRAGNACVSAFLNSFIKCESLNAFWFLLRCSRAYIEVFPLPFDLL